MAGLSLSPRHVNRPERGRAPAEHPAPDLVPLALALVALGAALAAQTYVSEAPWGSLAGFALGGILIALAARRLPAAPEPAPAPPPELSRSFRVLLGCGLALCTAAGVLVFRGRPPSLTHAVWLAGLLGLAVAAALPPAGVTEDGHRADGASRDTLLAGAALALVALIVFGWDLTALPVEVHGDDAEVGLDAIRLLGHFDLFGSGWFELPKFHAFPTAVGLEFFGINLLGLRATSAALGIGSVLLLFAVARRLWSFEVALLAALLLAGQRFFIHLSRAGYHYVDTPFLSLLVVWLLLRLWQDRRLGAAVWCGVALGLGIQTYYASRLVPLLLALTWLGWMRRAPRAGARGRVAAFTVIVLVALAVAAPMFGYFAHDWAAFWERTRDTSIFNPALHQHLAYGYGTDSLAAIVLIQLRAALGLFNARPDNSVQYGLNGPLFEPISAALFVLGAALVILRVRERRAQLVLLFTVLPLIVGAALTIDTPFYPRISGLMPFVMLMIALALQTLRDAVRAALPTRTGGQLVGALTLGAVALISATNLRTYFVDYASRYRVSPCLEIAAWVRAHGAGKTTYMVGSAPGFYIRHGTIAFLTYGYETRDVEEGSPWYPQRFDPAKSVFVYMPQGQRVIPQLEQSVGPLDVQAHHNRDGSIAFFTAIPRGHGSAPPDPPDRFDQPNAAGAGIDLLDRILRAVAVGALALLAISGTAVVGLALVGWSRRTRRPGLSALTVPLRERARRWRRRLVGPDDRERRGELPRAAIVALVVLVAAVALALRVSHLADLPAGFFCDEAGNGYNAFSLLHTGRDETGARFPLYVWSFGVSFKNPVFIYSAMLPTALLGPTELAVRLTAALYGFGTVLAMFFLGRALMGPTVGLLAALLLAVCPWHLHFSRIGFELIALPFFFTLALTSLVRWTQGRRTLPQAAVLFGLCLYTYVPAKLIVPLFLAGFALLYSRPLRARWRESALAAGLLLLTAAPVAVFDLTHRAQAQSYFRATTILAEAEPPLVIARRFAANYAAFFSRAFLFDGSDDDEDIIRHTVRGHGQLYPFFAPLLGLGAAVALLRRDRALRLPLLWLALYPVAPALMNEIPSASRGIAGAPAFCLLAAIGGGAVLRLATQVSERRGVVLALQGGLALAGLAVVVPAVRQYWALYRDEYPLYSAKYYTGFQYGHRQVLDYFRDHYDEYDRLLLTTLKSNQPEVFLRFYDGLRQPPVAGRVPPFEHRANMVVGDPAAYATYDSPDRRTLFAVLPEEVPLFADAQEQARIMAPDDTPAFVLVSASRLKDFVSTWQVTGPLPEHDRSPAPAWTPEDPPRGASAERWRLYDLPAAGVDLRDFFVDDADHACAWAVNFVTSENERAVRVFAGFADRGEVWANGSRVTLEPAGDPAQSPVDSRAGSLALRAGRSTIAVRTCAEGADWRFYFRLANLDGTPIDGLQWEYGPRAGAAPAPPSGPG